MRRDADIALPIQMVLDGQNSRPQWSDGTLRAEMQQGSCSRRRAKKRLSARMASMLRYATMDLPEGGVRLTPCSPGARGSIDLSAAECVALGQWLLSRASR